MEGSSTVRQCMRVRPAQALLGALALLAAAAAVLPARASADAPATPIATSYLARVGAHPPGVDAKVIDGYLSLWMQVVPSETVEVLDYQGAPWVRFDRAGVAVNENSEMYYLSQTPVPATPPAGLTRRTPPRWRQVSSGHSYMWRDGRLHALTTIALTPGSSYVGPWQIALRVDGHATTISGGVWHRSPPSPVWFWPIAVVILCVLAGWRVRRPELDAALARGLTLTLLLALALAAAARELHGRPQISGGQYVLLAVALLLVAAASLRVLTRRSGYSLLLAIAFISLWAGLTDLGTLLHGYVLLGLPAFVVRAATVTLLGGGAGLILAALRVLDQSRPSRRRSTRAVPA
jgi:hypothetical protein